MTYIVCSDIHGSPSSTSFIIDAFNKYKAKGIICLGDVLYHGPRNDLPEGYAPKEVISILAPYMNKTVFVKGNCDAEVDDMVLNITMPMSLDLSINDLNVHLEHGHHLVDYKGDADLVLYGHTHVTKVENKENQVFINPGSITIPKENTKRSIIIWEDHSLKLLSMDNTLVEIYKY